MTLPDGHVRTWSYGPWEVSASDENDSYDDDDNLHFGTPTVTHLDSLGRVYKIDSREETHFCARADAQASPS